VSIATAGLQGFPYLLGVHHYARASLVFDITEWFIWLLFKVVYLVAV